MKDMNQIPLFDHNELEKEDPETKFDQIISALNVLNNRFEIVHNILNNAQDGIDPRIDALADSQVDQDEDIEALQKENKKLRSEVDL